MATTTTMDAVGNTGNGSVTITDLTPVAPTPEPSSLILLGTGILGIAGVMRKRFA